MQRFRHLVVVLFVLSVVIQLSAPLTSSVAAQGPANQAGLKLVVGPRERVRVQFTTPATISENAWVGIVPSNVPHGSEAENDEHDVDYQYLEGKTNGLLSFEAPAVPGSYDIRMFDTDGDGKELASVTFEVVLTSPNIGKGTLSIAKASFAPGEEIAVEFTTDPSFPPEAWVGIIPADVPHGSEDENDQYDLSYLYLEGQTSGTLMFTAPEEPGSYDLRMHDTDADGVEVTSVTFVVK